MYRKARLVAAVMLQGEAASEWMDQAVAYLQWAVQRCRELLGPQHMHTALAKSNLAAAEQRVRAWRGAGLESRLRKLAEFVPDCGWRAPMLDATF